MPEKDVSKPLKIVLMLDAIILLVYGLGFILVPGLMLIISGGTPVDLCWLRWPGGALIALGMGAWLAARNPAKQGNLVNVIMVGSLLIGLALLYSILIGEYNVALWFITLPTCINLGFFALYVWSRQLAKDIL